MLLRNRQRSAKAIKIAVAEDNARSKGDQRVMNHLIKSALEGMHIGYT